MRRLHSRAIQDAGSSHVFHATSRASNSCSKSIMVASTSTIRLLAGRARNLPAWQPLALRDFRLLFIGQAVSLLGDQFYLVALPWLVLHELTGSVLALSTILGAATVPRMIFLLVGGAASDWLSPHRLMVASNGLRSIVCAILTVLVLFKTVSLWQLFVLAAAFGTLDAFFSPAMKAFIPALLDKEALMAGNALLQGTHMLTKFIGPALAGWLVVFGTGFAFGLDTVSFVFVTGCLMLMKTRKPRSTAGEFASTASPSRGKLLSSIRDGLRYTLHEPAIRSFIIIIAVIEFAFAGPFTVGLASLANSRFSGGSKAFGIMLATLGGGFLLGTVIAGAFKRSRLGFATFVGAFGLGTGLVLLGFAPNLVWACVLLAIMTAIGGCLQVLNIYWFQTRTDPQMLGRVMSVVMLCSFGLTPLSIVIAGVLVNVSLTLMFVVNGVFLLIAASFCVSSQRQIDSPRPAIG
jgi:MFS family permease